LDPQFARALDDLLPPDGQDRAIGLAVSGGSDSTALLHLAAGWAAHRPAGAGRITLRVATVDHRLRPESRAEAEAVGQASRALSLNHQILTWDTPRGPGNLAANARDARAGLLRDWAGQHGLQAVLLGHTADDQAETLLMRLARGSGVDGLSAMRPGRAGRDLFLRPLLGLRREALRDYLRDREFAWFDDPGNDDPAYDRIKARKALALLAPLGIDVEGLTRTAARMARARTALELRSAEAATCVTPDRADLLIEAGALPDLDDETRLRILAAALMWVGGQVYRPRLTALENAAEAAAAGRRATLHGVVIHPARGKLRLYREPAALEGQIAAPGQIWDRRWRLVPTGDHATDSAETDPHRVEMLGKSGLTMLDPPPATDAPRDSLCTLPAVWRQNRLICVPHLGFGAGFRVEWAGRHAEFREALLSH